MTVNIQDFSRIYYEKIFEKVKVENKLVQWITTSPLVEKETELPDNLIEWQTQVLNTPTWIQQEQKYQNMKKKGYISNNPMGAKDARKAITEEHSYQIRAKTYDFGADYDFTQQQLAVLNGFTAENWVVAEQYYKSLIVQPLLREIEDRFLSALTETYDLVNAIDQKNKQPLTKLGISAQVGKDTSGNVASFATPNMIAQAQKVLFQMSGVPADQSREHILICSWGFIYKLAETFGATYLTTGLPNQSPYTLYQVSPFERVSMTDLANRLHLKDIIAVPDEIWLNKDNLVFEDNNNVACEKAFIIDPAATGYEGMFKVATFPMLGLKRVTGSNNSMIIDMLPESRIPGIGYIKQRIGGFSAGENVKGDYLAVSAGGKFAMVRKFNTGIVQINVKSSPMEVVGGIDESLNVSTDNVKKA